MQQVESSFVFDNLIPKIRAKKGIILQTKHDSIICPANDLDLVLASFEEAFSEEGIQGALKVDTLPQICPQTALASLRLRSNWEYAPTAIKAEKN